LQYRSPRNLQQLLDCFRQAKGAEHSERVSLGDLLEETGRRTFAPLLLIPGVITLLPLIGDIPGVPTLMAIMVLLVSVQLLLGSEHFWLPAWLMRRSISREKLDKAIRWGERPARFIDGFLKPRLSFLTQGAGVVAVAIACAVIALAMPPMEVVPFTANGAGIALTLFGLSLMARDGLLAAAAFVLTTATLCLVVFGLL